MDKRNQQRAYSLSSKVSQLRSIAVEIENEAHDHNRLLDGLDGDFGSGSSLLGGSSGRLAGLMTAGRQNRRVMCYVAGGVVAVIFLFYYALAGSAG